MTARRAIIIGSEGQDGQILCDRLVGEGAIVLGIDYQSTRCHGEPWSEAVDALDLGQVRRAVAGFAPDAVYYLAAFHHSSEDRALGGPASIYGPSHRIHVEGLLCWLEAVLAERRDARLFYAASSHIYGQPPAPVQNEHTPLAPTCVYGITKAAGVQLCRLYRNDHGVGASVGILYNHESPLRRAGFLSKKIAQAAVRASKGDNEPLILGDLAARVDWGWAADTVDAMVRIVRHSTPDDFVVATGQAHSVADFAEHAYRAVGLDWRKHVSERPGLLTKARRTLVGDSSRLAAATGWSPSVTFERMVWLLVEHELAGLGAGN